MNTSIRNKIPGTIESIKSGPIMSEIVMDTPGGKIVSVITSASAESLGLAVGDTVRAQIKATNISIEKGD